MILTGNVESGIGTAKMWVNKINKIFQEKTGMILVLGTLNIKLNENYTLIPDWIINPEEFGGTEQVLIKKCKLFGNSAYIVRAKKNQIGKGEHNLQIIEIVSDINYRNQYNLKDGDEIQIEVF